MCWDSRSNIGYRELKLSLLRMLLLLLLLCLPYVLLSPLPDYRRVMAIKQKFLLGLLERICADRLQVSELILALLVLHIDEPGDGHVRVVFVKHVGGPEFLVVRCLLLGLCGWIGYDPFRHLPSQPDVWSESLDSALLQVEYPLIGLQLKNHVVTRNGFDSGGRNLERAKPGAQVPHWHGIDRQWREGAITLKEGAEGTLGKPNLYLSALCSSDPSRNESRIR
mmetsp:Transcript_2902/g.5605  ORF Transcript_2902/g.5605 Transcript_2902/m.5605 type:complete len:223 (-) Transcript_2902:188-856(-)